MPPPSRTRTKLTPAKRVSAKPATAIIASGTSPMNDLAEPDQGARDKRSDRRRQSVEEVVQVAGQVGLDVEDREAEHEQEAGQHEAEAGEEAAQPAAAQAAEVDAELVRLRAGKDLVDGEQSFEARLGDPLLFIDALALDHRDLRRRPAPGEAAELEEADEDRAQRFGAWGGGWISRHRGILTAVTLMAAAGRFSE